MSQVFRRIALRLHELGRADREWLVANLPTETRTEVERSLAELRAMGLPRDTSWRDALEPDSPRADATETEQGLHPDVAAVAGLDVERVAEMLGSEPDWVVAALLAIKDWSWSRDYLAMLEPERAQRLCQLAGTAEAKLGRSFQDALLALLAAKVRPSEPMPKMTNVNRFERMLNDLEGTVAAATHSSETIA